MKDLDSRGVVGDELIMTQQEHELTCTYGSKGRVTKREGGAGLSLRDTLACDIRDVRQITGSKYNQGIRGMLEYYRNNYPELMRT